MRWWSRSRLATISELSRYAKTFEHFAHSLKRSTGMRAAFFSYMDQPLRKIYGNGSSGRQIKLGYPAMHAGELIYFGIPKRASRSRIWET